jgi:crotonobetainyl-CoA:carnitine CoA-transferase CaiB-like acyl-CoA transferase
VKPAICHSSRIWYYRHILGELIEEIFLEKPHDEWLRRLVASDLPHGELRGIGQVVSHPQLLARKMIRDVESPVGHIPTVRSSLHLSNSPARDDRIPALGQNTKPILEELGYADAQIAYHRREGVI